MLHKNKGANGNRLKDCKQLESVSKKIFKPFKTTNFANRNNKPKKSIVLSFTQINIQMFTISTILF